MIKGIIIVAFCPSFFFLVATTSKFDNDLALSVAFMRKLSLMYFCSCSPSSFVHVNRSKFTSEKGTQKPNGVRNSPLVYSFILWISVTCLLSWRPLTMSSPCSWSLPRVRLLTTLRQSWYSCSQRSILRAWFAALLCYWYRTS